MEIKRIRGDYGASLKSLDTEDAVGLYVYRPLGFVWARIAQKLGMTPNAVTIFSIFIGVGAGVLFAFNDITLNVIGILLLLWAQILDCADGQLARMTKQYSRIGRFLDGLSGYIWFLAIYIALCIRENTTNEFFNSHPWLIWVMAVVAGLSNGMQASMGDYYRQLHLHFLNGEERSELDSKEAIKEKYEAISWGRNFFRKLYLWTYLNYTILQVKRTKYMQVMMNLLKEKYCNRIPPKFRRSFRRGSKPLMLYVNIISFNARALALVIALLIFRMPWLYFIFEFTILNAILIYTMYCHERMCRRFVDELNADKY